MAAKPGTNRLAALLAAATLLACAGRQEGNMVSEPDGSTSEGEIPAHCPLTIHFGSYAMGIDGKTLRRVESLLAGDPAVTGVTRSPWGREGEVTLCASIRSNADRDRLFAAVAALFPRRPRGPLSVRTNDGRELQANQGT
jgi:hypothetical protein